MKHFNQKVYLLILLFILSNLYAFSQMNSMSGIDPMTLLLWTGAMDDENEDERSADLLIQEVKKQADSLLKISENNFIRMNRAETDMVIFEQLLEDKGLAFITIDSIRSDQPDYFFIRDKHGKLRTAYFIHEADDYYLLCSKRISDPCNCGTSLYIYLPEKNKLKGIEKPFSFSMKRDLAFYLNKLTSEKVNVEEYENLCELITDLK